LAYADDVNLLGDNIDTINMNTETLIDAKNLIQEELKRRLKLGTPKLRRFDNIKINLLEMVSGELDWTGPAHDRYRWRALVNSVMNLRVP
jgi:hypothetical protein